MIAAHPLTWPGGWRRTPATARAHAHFGRRTRSSGQSWSSKRDLTIAESIDRVLSELERFGFGRDDIVISTNLPVRLDGLPRSDARNPDDPGAAVYWQERAGARRVIAIDQYLRVADNLAAIAATLEAMRAIERHGSAQILERAFTGFAALPAPEARGWRQVMGLNELETDIVVIRAAFRKLAAERHPDRLTGSHDDMAELNAALAAAEKELSL